MNTTIIENKFTGYRAEIRHAGDMPAISTVKRHLRQGKASDCISDTTIRAADGEKIELVDMGRGEELIWGA